MKYHVLVSGSNFTTIDNIFTHLDSDLDCITTSLIYRDIVKHIRLAKPDIFLMCLKHEEKTTLNMMKKVKDECDRHDIVYMILGEADECESFVKGTGGIVDLVLTRPISNEQIVALINKYMKKRENEREKIKQQMEDLQRQKEEAAEAMRAEQLEATKKGAMEKLLAKKVKEAAAELAGGASRAERNAIEEQLAKRIAAELAAAENTMEEQEAAKRAGRPAANTQTITQPIDDDRQKHILVVDDDANMLKTIKRQLEPKYEVATAVNGKLALRFLAKRSTDLILLDYEMPGESGAEVLAQLRANPDTANIPVVFLTGVSEKEKIYSVLQLNPQGYMLKPVDHDTLMSMVRKTIG